MLKDVLREMAEGPTETGDKPKPIDREKTCPLLLRVFCNTGRHYSTRDYLKGSVPKNELQIYTWMDATLKELTALVKEVNPDARRRGTFFDMGIVYPDPRGAGYLIRDIGSTCTGCKGADDNVTLASKGFVIGDYLDIAISPPMLGGSAGVDMRGGGGGGGRSRYPPY